jgi:hypothetical protein
MEMSSYRPAGFCPKCGYPFDGGRCPECGSHTAPEKLLPEPPYTKLRRYLRVGLPFLLGAVIVGVLAWVYRTGYWVRVVPSGTLIELASSKVLESGLYGGDDYLHVDEDVVAAARVPSLAARELTGRYRGGRLSKTQINRILVESFEVGRGVWRPLEADQGWHVTLVLKDPAKTLASAFACKFKHGGWNVWVDGVPIARPGPSTTWMDGLPWRVLFVNFALPPLQSGTHTIRAQGYAELAPSGGAAADLGHKWKIDVSQTLHVP